MFSQELLVKLIAQHPYRIDDPTHLSFPAQATITAQPGQNGNSLWYGNYGSQSGWFSPSYCRLQPAIRRRRHVRPNVSFNGFPTPKECCSLPSRTKSWNSPTSSLRESYPKERAEVRDTLTTSESRSSSPQPESGDDQYQQNHDSAEQTTHARAPSQRIDSRSQTNYNGESAHSCTEATHKRRVRPLRLLRFNSGSKRSRDGTVSPTKPVARPALFSNASKLRSLFKDRSERQAVDPMSDVSPPTCIYVECTSTPPLQQEHFREQCAPKKQIFRYDERCLRSRSITKERPVDPIEIWAAEFRMRQQQEQAAILPPPFLSYRNS